MVHVGIDSPHDSRGGRVERPGIALSAQFRGNKRGFTWRRLFALLAFGVAAWFAWSYYNDKYPAWMEEVRLSDGRVLVIKQNREYFDHYGTNQSWVTFSLPEMGGQQTWHSYLRPQRIDVHQGKVYAFGVPSGPRQFRYYHYPKYLMVAFVWDGKEFKRIGFMEIPPEIRGTENVYRCVPDPLRRIFTLREKMEKWCPPTGERGQFTKDIDLPEYLKLAKGYARLAGGTPQSE